MKNLAVSIVAGILFGFGLALSGMTDTVNIINFLDVSGDWNSDLLLVMVAAFVTTALGYWWILKLPAPLLHTRFELPEKKRLDKRLIIGAILFGVGWGLYGYCPGPAIAALGYGYANTWIFMVSLVVGVKGYDVYQAWQLRRLS